jgi:hypothetical protein
MLLSNTTCLSDTDRITFRPFIDKPVLELFRERFCEPAKEMNSRASGQH